MAKQKIHNGAVIDFLTPAELSDPVNQILSKLGQNAQFKRNIATGVADNAGNLLIEVGPRDGFLWSVMNVFVATNIAGSLFYNTPQALNTISVNVSNTGGVFFSKAQVILKGNDKLVFSSTGNTAGAQLSMSVVCIEVPFAHEAQLLL